jgi:hypothetical protein
LEYIFYGTHLCNYYGITNDTICQVPLSAIFKISLYCCSAVSVLYC